MEYTIAHHTVKWCTLHRPAMYTKCSGTLTLKFMTKLCCIQYHVLGVFTSVLIWRCGDTSLSGVCLHLRPSICEWWGCEPPVLWYNIMSSGSTCWSVVSVVGLQRHRGAPERAIFSPQSSWTPWLLPEKVRLGSTQEGKTQEGLRF